MLTYNLIDPKKKAFIFELDNVLYPERDYLLQVYYLFANFIEYLETVPPSNDLTDFMKRVFEHHGPEKIFDKAQEAFGLDEKYRENFDRLHQNARLPLKLLLYKDMLTLLQDIVVDRKLIFLVTDGNLEQQLNKIRQIEWNGLEKYLKAYFTVETAPKPDTASLELILKEHQLLRKDLVIIGASENDQLYAANAGVDYVDVREYLSVDGAKVR
ncbi:MAG TPA: HAD hydrolase-like protein [Sphingobacteriaceae bacterium]